MSNAGVGDDIRNLSAGRRDDGHARRERLDQHPAELLAPARGRLARRAQHVHRVQIRRHVVMLRGRHDANPIAVTTAPGRKSVLQRARAHEQRAPRCLQAIENRRQQREALFRNEAAEKADDRRPVGPSEACPRRGPPGRIGPELDQVHARRNDRDSSRTGLVRPYEDSFPFFAREHVGDGPAEGDDPVCTVHRIALEPVERRRIALRDVLECREHERDFRRDLPRDLMSRGDVRFLPAVHQIPGLGEQRRQLAAVTHEVDPAR